MRINFPPGSRVPKCETCESRAAVFVHAVAGRRAVETERALCWECAEILSNIQLDRLRVGFINFQSISEGGAD